MRCHCIFRVKHMRIACQTIPAPPRPAPLRCSPGLVPPNNITTVHFLHFSLSISIFRFPAWQANNSPLLMPFIALFSLSGSCMQSTVSEPVFHCSLFWTSASKLYIQWKKKFYWKSYSDRDFLPSYLSFVYFSLCIKFLSQLRNEAPLIAVARSWHRKGSSRPEWPTKQNQLNYSTFADLVSNFIAMQTHLQPHDGRSYWGK